MTFEDFELRRYGDKLQIIDEFFSTTTPLQSFLDADKPNEMEPLYLSGNKGIIRLISKACEKVSLVNTTHCDTGRGFKIKVGFGKFTTVVLLV